MPSSIADLAALGKMFEEHQPRLLEMLRRRIDPALAVRIDPEDLLAETYLLARNKWADYKAKSTMREYPWLYRIAMDCLIDAWRKHNRPCRDLAAELPWPDHSSVQIGLSLVARGAGPRTEAEKEEMRKRMREALALLRPKDREILRMRHDDGLSYSEAAEVLDLSENAATQRYLRALERLKTLWQTLYPETKP